MLPTRKAGLLGSARTAVAAARDFPGLGYDLICIFDALHDMGAQQGGYALGNQVPDETLHELGADAGFGQFRRAAETPFNRIFEARP